MLISHDHRFLFVHIQKTGGTSLATLLRAKMPDVRTFAGTHDHAAWARRTLGESYGRYFSFAFVRNPWERLVSWYAMIVHRAQTESQSLNRFWRYVLDHARTFDEFLYGCTDTIEDVDGRKSILYNQLDYISDEAGTVIVDFVGRYERFNQDAGVVLQKLGLGPAPLPHENQSDHRDYRSYYTDDTRRLVAERYARDIEHFGYRF
jgi:hypothetical protein